MYRIDLTTIREYLATLGTDEAAGETGDATECPVARAGKHRYGIEFYVTTFTCYPSHDPSQSYIPPVEIAEVIRAVDRLRVYGPVTRREVEKILEEIQV